jgi:HPt (histidine-containing phosphotransfer) domain-containing protein
LQHAVETADLETVEKIAHSLKGSLGYLGLPRAAAKARDLERMGRERELHAAAEVIPSLRTEVSAVAAEMRELLEEKAL